MKSRGFKVLAALAITLGLLPIQAFTTIESAHAANTQGTRYYGNQLAANPAYPTASTFYKVLEDMDLATGKSITITSDSIAAQAAAYADGDDALIRNFGAAVDSFKYDHSEIFYVNWDNLTVNVYRKSGKYQVEIGAGRTDSYLLDPSLSEDDIRAQIAAYESAVQNVTAAASNSAAGNDAKSISEAAMKAVCNKVEYSFCDGDAEQAKYVQTAYGAAVNGKSVCEGYSRLFKQVMDRLNVQTELVYGNYLDGDKFEAHMWNYVFDPITDKGEGAWYAVDVTACDGHTVGGGTNPENIKKYFWRTADMFSVDHVEGYVISSVLYEMPYPKLRDMWKTPTNCGRFKIGSGIPTGSNDTFIYVSYDGLSADELQKQRGLYMAVSNPMTNRGVWEDGIMQSVQEWIKQYPGSFVSEPGKTWMKLFNKATPYWEVGIFDIPDDRLNSSVTNTWNYSDDAFRYNLIETFIIDNPDYDASYRKPSYIDYGLTTPEGLFQKRQDITKPIHCEIVYEDELRLAQGAENAVLTWDVSSYNNRSMTLDSVREHASMSNVKFQGDKIFPDGKKHGVISFDFVPSRQFNHNMIWYNFTVENVVNILLDESDGVRPSKFSLVFAYSGSTACSNVFGDGRLWINTYAQPYLVADSNMSMQGWKFEDGTGISEAQRSHMALVVTTPTVTDDTDEKLPENTLQSKTYEIDLNICGKHPVIPDGSYLQMNLGIPDEFAHLVGKENVTFELYHFKRNSDGSLNYDKPEVIPCTITKYGIVAKVTSFSPYVLVATDTTGQGDLPKPVSINSDGRGGNVSIAAGSDPVQPGSSITYQFTPDEGCELEYVKLDGKDCTVTDGKVTLSYDELGANNVLSCGFVSSAVKQAEEKSEVELITAPSAFDRGLEDGETLGNNDDNPGNTPGNGENPGDDNPVNGGNTGNDNTGNGDNSGNNAGIPGTGSNPVAGQPTTGTDNTTVNDMPNTMLNGTNGIWTTGGSKKLTFRSGANFADFVTVRVNGKELVRDQDYKASAGSIIIELQPSFLKTLPVGTHQMEIVATTGTATAPFKVITAGENTDNTTNSNNIISGPQGTTTVGNNPTTSPTPNYGSYGGADLAKTGDDTAVSALLACMMAAGAVFVMVTSFFSGRLVKRSEDK